MALIENLQDIKAIKEEIKTSIENKGVDTTNSTFADYPELIDSIETGGGEVDFAITNCRDLFIGGERTEELSTFYKIVKPIDGYRMFGASSNTTCATSQEELNYINKIDFSECTSLANGFGRVSYSNFPSELILDLPNCLSVDSIFYGYALCYNTKKVVFKNSNKVTDWDYCFYGGLNSNLDNRNKKIEEIELDMSACTNCTNFFNMTSHTYSGCMYLSKITFTGSFGGDSNTNTLTLDLSKLEAMTKDSFVSMFESLGTNTNGKTRIIQISTTIYDTMTEDELAIATSKGYTITSA